MPTLDVKGVSLFYEDGGSGQALVLSHGIPTDYRAWTAQVGPFSKVRRVVYYSRRYAYPNTRQGNVTDSTIQSNTEDLGGLVERLGLGPIDLLGHSYGGFLAANLAVQHPELVRSLTLVEPAISTLLLEDEGSTVEALSLLLRSPSVALSARRFVTEFLRPSLKALDAGQTERAVELNVDGVQDRPGSFQAMAEPQRKMMLDNARTIAELRTSFPPFKAQISKVSCKTLVVNGERSAPWLKRIGELAASSIPNAQHRVVPGARHFPHMENAPEFNRLVLDFLAATA